MRCPSRKKPYNTPADAMLALERIQNQRDVDALDKYERTWYDCDCGKIHLTSWTREDQP